MKILLADDSKSILVVLEGILRELGHDVLTANNGQEAVETFKNQHPDMVFMDIIMPIMDGHEATRQIRKHCIDSKQLRGQDSFIPIIFLTGLKDDAAHIKCVESGGDDFIAKPFTPMIVKARVEAMQRIKNAYATTSRQKLILQNQQEELMREMELANSVLATISNLSESNIKGVRSWLERMTTFSGDLILMTRGPDRLCYTFLGDFTGHGLPAALGVIPTAQIFYKMAAKGFQLSTICREINKQLYEILPVEVFCAACVIMIDSDAKIAKIWNGGMPPVYVTNAVGRVIQKIKSHSLALGICDDKIFDDKTVVLKVKPKMQLFACSDGITEARNIDGEMYGDERMIKSLVSDETGHDIFDGIINSVKEFTKEAPTGDDIVLLGVDFSQID